jgi:sirohydrochlorin cobaltochelatase
MQHGELEAGGTGVTGEGTGTRSVPVIGLAHGSRHPDGARAIGELMRAVAERGRLDARPAYLDLAAPDLETVVRDLAAAGHRAAVVVPLLFTSAFHATVDVPDAVRDAAQSVGLELVVADILGTGDDIAAMLRTTIADAGIDDAMDLLLFAVGSSNPAANQAVAALATRLGADRDGSVDVGFGTCTPRARDVLADRQEPVAIIPLFLAEGLLLDPMRALAAERHWPITPSLGARAADVVLRRVAAVGPPAQLG